MLLYERINIFVGINLNKSDKSKECMIIIGILKTLIINTKHMFVMGVIIYKWLLMI